MKKHFFRLGLIFGVLVFLYQGLYAQDAGLDNYVDGEIMRRGKSYNIAVLQYNEAVKKAPANYRYTHARGLCYLALKNYDKAIEDFKLTLHINKGYVPSYLSLAEIYQLKKDKDNIIKNFDNAFFYEKDTIKRTSYKLKIIQMLYDAENLSIIEAHVKSAKLANPNSLPILYYDAVISNEKKEHSVAANSIERAIKIGLDAKMNPDILSRYYYQLAYAYHWLEKYAEADAAIKKIVNPTYKTLVKSLSPEYTYQLAYAFYKVYEFDDAENLLQKCLKMDKKYVNAHDLHFNIEDMSRDHTKLINHLKNSISHETENEPLKHKYKDICELYITNGKYKECIDYASQCLKKFPEYKEVLFLKGVAEKRSQKYKAAAKTMEKLVSLKEPDIEKAAKYHFKMGRIYEKLANYEKAKASFRKAFYGGFKNAAREELKTINEVSNSK